MHEYCVRVRNLHQIAVLTLPVEGGIETNSFYAQGHRKMHFAAVARKIVCTYCHIFTKILSNLSTRCALTAARGT